jgi:hypothetical protein
MIRRRNPVWLPASLPLYFFLMLLVALLTIQLIGCKSKGRTADPRLKKIDNMLSAQLPKGTQRGRVEFFLNSRGYRVEDSPDKNVIVAIVRHIDTETLRPATARVTFHFDSNNKLVSYDLQPAPDAPPQP